MNIGERIRALRNAKMMTQTELAGKQITRNMLSRIENGSALPSLSTIMYLAARLGVPAGFLLAEEGDEFYYKKMNAMPNIKRAYTAGDFRICRDICMSLGGSDDEISSLICLCSFNMAKEKFCEGKLADAVELFEEASVQKTSTMYPMVGITETAAVYLAYIRDISPSLYSDYQDDARPVSAEAMIDPFCRYYLVLRALDGESGSVLARLYLERASAEEGQYAAHIRARVAIGKQNYQEAYGELRSLLTGEGEVAAPMMYFIFSDLERCCSAMSDYRCAYEYSSDKMGLLEKFLRLRS